MRAAERVLRSLEPAARALVVGAALHAARRGGRAWLVGGVVRDALLGRLRADLDLALELPSPAAVAALLRALRAEAGGTLHLHEAFGTGTLEAGGFHLDAAMSRSERYPHPAALPVVTPAPIRADLARRDYRVNALAVALPPAAPALLDPWGGMADLATGTLRTLHGRSLADDPTRIVRGARLAARLGFAFAPAVAREARAQLRPDVLRFLSSERRRDELELLLAEDEPGAALLALDAIGALTPIYGVEPDGDLRAALRRLDRARPRPDERDARREAYLLLLAGGGPAGAGWLGRFGFPARLAARAERVAALAATWRGRDAGDEMGEGDPAFARLAPPERFALAARLPQLRAHLDAAAGIDAQGRERRVLRGSDVLRLGLSEGPDVGRVLRLVAQARAAGRVRDFAGELELARSLVADTARASGSAGSRDASAQPLPPERD